MQLGKKDIKCKVKVSYSCPHLKFWLGLTAVIAISKMPRLTNVTFPTRALINPWMLAHPIFPMNSTLKRSQPWTVHPSQCFQYYLPNFKANYWSPLLQGFLQAPCSFRMKSKLLCRAHQVPHSLDPASPFFASPQITFCATHAALFTLGEFTMIFTTSTPLPWLFTPTFNFWQTPFQLAKAR